MNDNIRIKDLPDSEKPRERLIHHGADALSAAELIAILLRTGLKGASVLKVAEQIVCRFKTLDDLSRASREELQKVKGVGRDKAVTLAAAFALARKMAREVRTESPVLDNPQAVADLLREESRVRRVECFQVLLLNTRRRLIRVEDISHGTLDTILVHPREVFRQAISANASAIVLVHNHPGGDPSPSEADVKVTRDL